MLMILISGLTAGPAVSLYGSPTVSPVTAALCASLPLPPKWPSSMYFLALSQAPPPVHIEMATNRPVTMVPISRPPSAAGPSSRPTRTGTTTGSSDGTIISLIAARGQHVDGLAVLGLAAAVHDALDVAELAAHFLDHRAGGAADGLHRHRAEQVGDHAADEQADDHRRVATGRT